MPGRNILSSTKNETDLKTPTSAIQMGFRMPH